MNSYTYDNDYVVFVDIFGKAYKETIVYKHIMVDKPTLMRSFNAHFVEMMTDILVLYPNNAELKSGLNSFEMFKNLNPSLVLKAWYSKVYIPYYDIIKNGDISFFCEKDYSQDLGAIANANDIMNLIEKLRSPIRSMSTADKDHTIKYIQNLCVLSEMYSTC